LSESIKNLNSADRSGNALVFDSKFDQLERNLRRIDQKNNYLNQKMVLPLIGKGRKDEFLERILPDTKLIIAPNIVGCSILLSYENGFFKKAVSSIGKEVCNGILKVKNIPKCISCRSIIHIRGELFGRGLSPENSEKLSVGFLKEKNLDGKGLSFCAYQILNGELNYFSSLQILEKLGFEIPETETTKYISDVEQYKIFWKEGKLFSEYPTDGIVLTVNSRKLQKQLGNKYSICLEW
tara:strand:- start:826 stop:1539 length:714 start_codon:yes stop_codon:yes gene_type:complete